MSGIAVVIPVLNERQSIRTLIQGLLDQTMRPDEIIITDAGSTDGTVSLIEEFCRDGAPVVLLRECAALPGRGRNVGVSNTKRDWIVFVDGGIRPERDWLEWLVNTARAEQADVVYGSYEPNVTNFFTECAAIAYVTPPTKCGGRMARSQFIASTLLRREVWQAVGGFREDLRSAEDLLFMQKIERAGFRIARAPQAVVHWNLQPSLWQTFKRFVTYSRNNIRAGLWREWQLVIFLRYALLLVSLIPAWVIGWRWLLVTIGLWLGFMMARAVKAIYRNRMIYAAGFIRNIGRLFVIVPLLTAIDIAAFTGSIDWFVRDKLRLGKTSQ